ncbi:7-cyano-7-deazaguanine synthase QueC [Thiofilum flexile]|uniref:7-cyano-7-deazaguanine synthase QueC n=1 Tax=Thiofilum flexile TaxID=125627 RepID=UPI00037245FE|nr:7-cyano-7-deazaguanine synthase QueC [Thiofilum flexile]
MKKAVVLFSGGLDSTTVLALVKARGYEVHALSFSYGQRHSVELEMARRVAAHMSVSNHSIINIDPQVFQGSALTSALEVPKNAPNEPIGQDIPITYVPARNTIFLSFALGLAEVIGADDIFLGVNAVDYSGYPDCRPEFIAAYEQMANLATKAAVQGRHMTIHTPLAGMNKAMIVQEGMALQVDYSLTSSCYDPAPDGRPCTRCDSCVLRAKGFAEAGLKDPLWVKFGLI